MKKLLLGLGIGLILGLSLYFTARSWVRTQTLRAVESTTGAKVQAQVFSLELWTGRVSLGDVTLTPVQQTAPIERMTFSKASGQIRWSEWSSGVIPMEATLEEGTITLRQQDGLRHLKKQICLSQPAPSLGGSAPPTPLPEKSEPRIILTVLTAKHIAILNGTNQAALVGQVNCSARRSLDGWRGERTAESIGPETNPLTQVQIGFSTENQGIRVAEFQCYLKEGTVSGNGWCSENGAVALDLQVDALQLASIAPTWSGNIISGIVSGRFNYDGNPVHWQLGTVTGSFVLKESALKLGAAS